MRQDYFPPLDQVRFPTIFILNLFSFWFILESTLTSDSGSICFQSPLQIVLRTQGIQSRIFSPTVQPMDARDRSGHNYAHQVSL